MHIAGLVHDVGKIGVPEAVLLKPGRLTEEEFNWIRKHPGIGYRILKDIPQLKDILPGVLYHHERWDGGGYPQGLSGRQIPLVARLIALADAFDAMSSNRPYRPDLSREHVLDEILKCSGTQLRYSSAAARSSMPNWPRSSSGLISATTTAWRPTTARRAARRRRIERRRRHEAEL
jgi:HD-GYP domain-containing protein (c-di-GMP phosphodiesterase class II)